jgi:hypothetical protein
VAQKEIVVFPWLSDLREPMTVCGAVFLPRGIAIERARDNASAIEAATSYFFEPYVRRDASGKFELTPLEPAVVLLNGVVTGDIVETAAQILAVASVAASVPNAGLYANSAVFAHFQQTLGGAPGFVGRRTRRMHGSARHASHVDNVIEVRPIWCGRFVSPNGDLVRALEAMVFTPRGAVLRYALSSLFLATGDADNYPADIERSMYARAAERLLHDKADHPKRRRGLQEQRGRSWFAPIMTAFGVNATGQHVLDARSAMFEQRNEVWHPNARKLPLFPFEQQTAIAQNLIVFRALLALLIGFLVDAGAVAPDSMLAAFVPAIDQWLGAIVVNDPRDPERASDLATFLSPLIIRAAVKRAMTATP